MAQQNGILTSGVLARINRPTPEAVCLPNACYTDPEFLALERERLFFDRWISVAVASQLPQPGDVLPVSVAGLPAFVLRDRQGVLRAYHNVCRHRGMRLVGEAQRKKRVLVCPYHSWTYGLDGSLQQTPHFEGEGRHEPTAFDKCDMGLEPIRLGTWHDLIFLNVSGKAGALADEFRGLDARWKDYDLSALRYAKTVHFDINANWKLAVENFLESYHLPWAHPALNSFSRMEDHACILEPGYFGQLSYAYNSASAGHGALPSFASMPADWQKRAEYPTFLPNLMLGIHPDHFFVFTADPDGAGKTRETFHFYFVGDAAMTPEMAGGRERVIESWASINREDIFVVEGMQVGRHSPAYRDARFSPHHEPTTHEFQRRIANIVAGRGPVRTVKRARPARAPARAKTRAALNP
jgi:choline monooxygenase